MRGPACRAICIIGQAVPLVHGAGPLILVVMATERHINLQMDLSFNQPCAALAHSRSGSHSVLCAQSPDCVTDTRPNRKIEDKC